MSTPTAARSTKPESCQWCKMWLEWYTYFSMWMSSANSLVHLWTWDQISLYLKIHADASNDAPTCIQNPLMLSSPQEGSLLSRLLPSICWMPKLASNGPNLQWWSSTFNGRLSIFNYNCSSSYNQLRSRLFEAKNLFWRGSMHRPTSQKLPTYQSEKETLMIDIVPCFWRHHVAIILTIGGTQHSNHIISLVSRVNSFKAQIQLKTILDSIKSFESVMSL